MRAERPPRPRQTGRLVAWLLLLLSAASAAFLWILPARRSSGESEMRFEYSGEARAQGASR